MLSSKANGCIGWLLKSRSLARIDPLSVACPLPKTKGLNLSN
jgi:hypothetical protein